MSGPWGEAMVVVVGVEASWGPAGEVTLMVERLSRVPELLNSGWRAGGAAGSLVAAPSSEPVPLNVYPGATLTLKTYQRLLLDIHLSQMWRNI